MDHPASLSRPQVWRTTALVAGAVAALELVLLLILAFSLVWSPFGSGDGGDGRALPGKRSARPHSTPKAVAKLPRSKTSVLVLNGNGRPGAAGEAADLVRSRRYLIAGTGNAPRSDFRRSIVMFRPGFRGEAQRLARDFHIRRVAPLDGLERADLQGAHIAFIVGDA